MTWADSMSYRTSLYNKSYSHEWAPTKADMIRINKALALVEKNGKVLDIGCFTGVIGGRIMKKGNEVYGTELSMPAIKKANKRGLRTIRCDTENIFPVKSGYFDGVFAGEIIEHLYNVEIFLKEINRVLKEDGYLVMTTPNLVSFWNRFRMFLGIPFIDFNKDKQHIRFFSKKTLKVLVEKNGFRTEKIMDTPLMLPVLSRFGIITERSLLDMGENIILKARKISATQ